MTGQSRSANRDSGSVTTEMVIVAPIALVLLCLVTLVGRTASARDLVDSAAHDAARSASLERSPRTATDAATKSAARSLETSGVRCAGQAVNVDVSAFRPGGQVTVSVSCDIKLSDLGLLGLQGTRQISSTSVSVVDRYRASS